MTYLARVVQATMLLAESPRTVTDLAVALDTNTEVVRRWLHKLAQAGLVVRTKCASKQAFGRRHVDEWTLRRSDVKHFEGCWAHGPAHYWCALDEIHRLEDERAT